MPLNHAKCYPTVTKSDQEHFLKLAGPDARQRHGGAQLGGEVHGQKEDALLGCPVT